MAKFKLFLSLSFILILSLPAYGTKPFYKLTPLEVSTKQKEIFSNYPSYEDRIAAFAQLRANTPYILGPLGENDSRGPVFQTKTVDCTVFVLTTLALAMTQSYKDAEAAMSKLNYHNPPVCGKKVVSYQNRYHFTYDRITSNPLFTNITSSLLPSEELKKASVKLNIKSSGERLLNIPWSKKVSASYIPNSKIDRVLLSKIPSKAVGIALVRVKAFKLGVVVSHEGFLIDRRFFINADSISGKVEKVDFLEYIRKNSDYFDGIIVSEFN